MRIARFLVVGVLVAVCGNPAWPAGAADRYQVPDGGAAELVAFIQQISQIRPETPQEDIRHRQNARPVIRRAAERILEIDGDPDSEARQAAGFLVMVERIRSIAQDDPDPQQTVQDVKSYLAELIEAGQHRVAADVALLLGQTLLQAGEWQHAVDAFKAISPLFAASKDARISAEIRAIEANAEGVLATLEETEAAGKKAAIRPTGPLVPLDLSDKWNRKMVDFSGSGDFEGNGLAELPQGERELRGVMFRIGDGVIQLGSTNAQNEPAEVEGVAVGRTITRLYALHATQWGAATPVVSDGTAVGEFQLHYEDGSAASLPIVYGEDVRDWWTWDGGRPLARGTVAWTGANLHTERYGIALRLCLSVWDNPHPEKNVSTLSYASTMDTPAAPFCVAVTVEGRRSRKR